jgi:hypothetical protein
MMHATNKINLNGNISEEKGGGSFAGISQLKYGIWCQNKYKERIEKKNERKREKKLLLDAYCSSTDLMMMLK